MIIFATGFICANVIFGCIAFIVIFSGLEITIVLTIYLPMKIKKNPYKQIPEEISKLKKILEIDYNKKLIKELYKRGRSVCEIAQMLKKYQNIELHIRKGLQSGEIKSKKLYRKIDEILGINTQQIWESTISNYHINNTYIDILREVGAISSVGMLIIFLIWLTLLGCPFKL